MVKKTVQRLNNSNLLGLTERNIESTCAAIDDFLGKFNSEPHDKVKGELLVFPCEKGENPAKWLKVIVRARKNPMHEKKIGFALSIFLLSKHEFNECRMLQLSNN